MTGHQLEFVSEAGKRPYWRCTCTGTIGPGWVCYQTQRGKPDLKEAERLHARHVEDCNIPEEEWW